MKLKKRSLNFVILNYDYNECVDINIRVETLQFVFNFYKSTWKADLIINLCSYLYKGMYDIPLKRNIKR